MKFEEALIKLRKIAKGKYCNLTYGITVRPSGEREVVLLVGPTEPATNLGLSGVIAVYFFAASAAILADS